MDIPIHELTLGGYPVQINHNTDNKEQQVVNGIFNELKATAQSKNEAFYEKMLLHLQNREEMLLKVIEQQNKLIEWITKK